jgi:hypothetical protein
VRAQDELSAERATLEAQAAADPLEAYMLANTAEVHANRARALSAELSSVDDEVTRLHKLLSLVAPALPPMAPPPPMAPSAPMGPPQPMGPPTARPSAGGGAQPKDAALGPPPHKRPKLEGVVAQKAAAPTEVQLEEEAGVAGAAAGAAPSGGSSARFQADFAAALASYQSGAMDAPNEVGEASTGRDGAGNEGEKPAPPSKPPPMPMLPPKQPQAMTAPPVPVQPARPRPGPMLPPPSRPLERKSAAVAHAGEEDGEWRPPEGQTGDGKTSLNAKLGY